MSVNGNTETNLPGEAIPWVPHRSSINQTREETGRRQRPSYVLHVGAHFPMQIALDWDPDGAVRRRLTLGSESGWPVGVKHRDPELSLPWAGPSQVFAVSQGGGWRWGPDQAAPRS